MGITNNNWDDFLIAEFKKPYFLQLRDFTLSEYKYKDIFPPVDMIFNAFSLTPPDKIKVVIVGQDPYHKEGQAHGLAFSVPDGVKVPPSLRNIFKELNSDLGIEIPQNGSLVKWAKSGVFLINSVLTVEKSKPESHSRKGWETFTDEVISYINKQSQPIVYLLWGKNAQAKEKLVTNPKHLVLTSHHPSPLSANKGFFGCKHFSKANEFLKENNVQPVDWNLI